MKPPAWIAPALVSTGLAGFVYLWTESMAGSLTMFGTNFVFLILLELLSSPPHVTVKKPTGCLPAGRGGESI